MQKIAIVGGGVAGSCAAYLLQDKFDVTLFEENNYLGGNNCSEKISENTSLPVSVIVFPGKQVFKHFHEYSEKFKLPLKTIRLPHIFKNNENISYKFGGDYKIIQNIHFNSLYQDAKDLFYLNFKFNSEIIEGNKRTVNDLIKEKKLSEKCVKYFLLPFASLYLSMSYRDLFHIPLSILSLWWQKYCLPTNSLNLYTYIEGGNHKLIDAFIKNAKIYIRLKSPVTNIERNNGKIVIYSEGSQDTFDKVIIATRPDEALNILNKPSDEEKKILSNIDTGMVKSTLHTDATLSHKGFLTLKVDEHLEVGKHVVSTWGHNTCFGSILPYEHYTSIHDINICPVDETKIIKQHKFKVPLPTSKTLENLKYLSLLNNKILNTYYCGSYFECSFYHEDALASAIRVAHEVVN